MATATLLNRVEGFNGSALLYRVSEPLSYMKYNEDGEGTEEKTRYIILSAVNAPYSGPEVLAFPATYEGEVLSWSELFGTRGDLEHERALEENGYTVLPFGVPEEK